MKVMFVCVGLGAFAASAAGQLPASYSEEQSPWVIVSPEGKLAYRADEKGNTIPDFSRAGYRGGEVVLPVVPVVKEVEPMAEGDDGERLQAALDEAGKFPADKEGRRGTVLLRKGTYRVAGSLKIPSGVVLRGEGSGEDGTLLIATGAKRRPFIVIGDEGEGVEEMPNTRRRIRENYVPSSADSFSLENVDGLKVGDRVVVLRPGTEEWLSVLGMNRIPRTAQDPNRRLTQWTPEGYTFRIERTITEIDGGRVTVDAPMMIALEEKYGGGWLYQVSSHRAAECGIESIRLDCEYEKGGEKTDVNHAGPGVKFLAVEDAWARDVTILHMDPGFVTEPTSIYVTILDCRHLDPVGPIRGGFRASYPLWGQYGLVERCFARNTRHAFLTGARVIGPNVFLESNSEETHADSGPHQRYAIGTLYDNIQDDHSIIVQDRGDLGSGHGWAGAQQVLWNCVTPILVIQSPPTARNYAIGCQTSEVRQGRFEDRPQGSIESLGRPVKPQSLYRAQRAQRLGVDHPSQRPTE